MTSPWNRGRDRETGGADAGRGDAEGDGVAEDDAEGDGPEAVAFRDRPARTSAALAFGVGSVSILAAMTGGSLLAAVAGAGVVAVGAGAFAGRRRLLTLGAVVIVLAELGLAAAGADPLLPLVGAAAAAAAWDLGEYAVGLGEQVGADARTRQAELAHAAASVGLAALAVGVAYGVYRVGAGGRPVTALVLLLVGAVALLLSLRT